MGLDLSGGERNEASLTFVIDFSGILLAFSAREVFSIFDEGFLLFFVSKFEESLLLLCNGYNFSASSNGSSSWEAGGFSLGWFCFCSF